MRALFESISILIVLFLLLRVSLTRPRHAVRLRGGLIALNVVTGMLAGGALAVAGRDLAAASAAAGAAAAAGAVSGGAVDPAVSVASAYAELGAAIIRVLPVLGLMLGGLAGHLLFGSLWRRLLKDGPAATRTWLRRFQFVLCLAAVVVLAHRLL